MTPTRGTSTMRTLDPVILAIGEHTGAFRAADLEPDPEMRPGTLESALARLTRQGVIDQLDEGVYRRVRGRRFDGRYLGALIALTPDVSALAGARLAALGPGHLLWIRMLEERLLEAFRDEVAPHADDEVAEHFRLLLTTRPAMLMLSLPRVRGKDEEALDLVRRRIRADILPFFEIRVAPHIPAEAAQRFRWRLGDGSVAGHAWMQGAVRS